MRKYWIPTFVGMTTIQDVEPPPLSLPNGFIGNPVRVKSTSSRFPKFLGMTTIQLDEVLNESLGFKKFRLTMP